MLAAAFLSQFSLFYHLAGPLSTYHFLFSRSGRPPIRCAKTACCSVNFVFLALFCWKQGWYGLNRPFCDIKGQGAGNFFIFFLTGEGLFGICKIVKVRELRCLCSFFVVFGWNSVSRVQDCRSEFMHRNYAIKGFYTYFYVSINGLNCFFKRRGERRVNQVYQAGLKVVRDGRRVYR